MRRVFVSLLVAAGAFAGEAERLREDIASLEFLNRLALTREQALALLPFAERGAFARRELERDRDAIAVRFHDALVRFREEDLKDAGLSDAVLGEVVFLEHALRDLGGRAAAALAPLEERALALLSPAQRAFAGVASSDDRHPLDLLRDLEGSDYDELRDALARALANARVAQGLATRHARRDLRLRLAGLLDQVKRWDDWEYARRREDLLRGLVPGWERAQVAAEIHRIGLARHGRVGPLGEHLFREGMLPVLAERAGIDAPRLPEPESRRTVAADLDAVNRRIAELRADINLLNLMNGLHLDRAQLSAIRKAARACRPEESPTCEGKEQVQALREVYAALRRGETPPASARVRLQSPIEKRGGGYLAARRRELEEARAQGVADLLEVLSPEQGEVIRTYAACLVPPKNLRDPVRAGQANDTDALEELVDRLRALDLSGDARAAADGLVRAIEAHQGALPAAERNARVQLALDVAREAHALDPVAYAAQRAELAARLRPLNRLETLKQHLMRLDGADRVIEDKIAAFLLDPRIVPLVEDRLARLDKAGPAKVDVPKAERCDDGECGRP